MAIALTPDIKSKLAMLKTKIGDPAVNPWGQAFLKSVCADDRNAVSDGQLATIEKMFHRFCKNQATDKSKIVRSSRVSAFRTASGYQLYIDNKAVGVTMTFREAEVLTIWFAHSLESLEYVLKQEKPVIPVEGEKVI